MIRPYEEVVAEIRQKWNAGVALLKESLEIAREQGFFQDVADMVHGLDHVESEPVLRSTPQDPMQRFLELQRRLDLRASHETPRGEYEEWLMCPREHAVAHGMRVPRQHIPISNGRELFRMMDRLRDGDDLVYAIGQR